MEDPKLARAPVVKAGILIRGPAADVFEALVDPGRREWYRSPEVRHGSLHGQARG